MIYELFRNLQRRKRLRKRIEELEIEEKIRRYEEEKRASTPFSFSQNFNANEFEQIAIQTAKPIKRLTVEVKGPSYTERS